MHRGKEVRRGEKQQKVLTRMTTPPTMYLERLQVEGGFLNGLDLAFGDGLTTIIGPRGSGKTSVLELIRFAIGVEGHTSDTAREADEHARAALGDGRIVLTVRIGQERYSLTRTAELEDRPFVEQCAPPLVLSQGEVESIGISAKARLRLVDSFRAGDDHDEEVKEAQRRVNELASEYFNLASRVADARERIDSLKRETSSADEIRAEYEKSKESLQGAQEKQKRVEELSTRLAARGVERSVLDETGRALAAWRQRIGQLAGREPSLPAWPAETVSEDPLADIRSMAAKAQDALVAADRDIGTAETNVEAILRTARASETEEREEFRKLRNELEGLQAGAGELAKRLADLEARQRGLQAAIEEHGKAERKLAQTRAREAEELDNLDASRTQVHEARSAIARFLQRELGPSVAVSVEQAGTTSSYANAVAATLRGSGMQYNALAKELSSKLSPRELVDAVRSEDVTALTETGGLSANRARKVIEVLAGSDLGYIQTAELPDLVRFSLLDGDDYKPTDRLSTGQRCTVVLSILLSHRDRPLIVDQPEDHLDNAFVVDTLVKAVTAASAKTQIIVSTHNANIPVLGEASKVVVLASDGDRGFVRHEGSLDDPAIVDHITRVMEGGREAFDRRARFYAKKDA